MRRLHALTAVSALMLAACGGGDDPGSAAQAERSASARSAAVVPASPLARLAVPPGAAGASGGQRIVRPLQAARGPVDVWVSLEAPSVSAKRREMAPALPRQARSAAIIAEPKLCTDTPG
jgi:hypothetical protein